MVHYTWFRLMEEKDEMVSAMSRGLFSIIHKKGSQNRLGNYWPQMYWQQLLAKRIKSIVETVVGSMQACNSPDTSRHNKQHQEHNRLCKEERGRVSSELRLEYGI